MAEQYGKIRKNVQKSQEARLASRYQKTDITDEKVKLSSKNFDKLMEQRGLPEEARSELKNSMVKDSQMQVRHAKAGEKFVVTHGKERSSGIFVSEKSLGKTPSERINKGALPHSNSAEYETQVELSKSQNLVYGKIASQPKFSKMDPKEKPRNGGGEQVITDGGYNSGAVINRDTKYLMVKDSFKQQAYEYKEKRDIHKTKQNSGKLKGKSNGQSV